MLDNRTILRIYGEEYKENTKKILEKAGLEELIPSKDKRILIKPNLVSPTPASFGATTHPEVVAGLVEYLQEKGFTNIVIAEGSWVGDKTSESVDVCGYLPIFEEYGVEFIDTQLDTWHPVQCGDMELNVCDCVKGDDYIINVPVLKGHCQTSVTCALKNMKGLIPNPEKRRFHSMGLHKPIGLLQMAIPQDFILVDHICGDPYIEDGGHPLVKNCIMAATDPVLVDALVCKVLGYEVSDVPYIKVAEDAGAGSSNLSGASIVSYDGEMNVLEGDPEGVISSGDRLLETKDAVEEVESCSACYGSLIPALERLREEGLLSKLDETIRIGQGFRGKTGELGVGDCTGEFNFCIHGCPPDEDDIYAELKDYINKKSQGIRR
ncbi:MAG: DUF362 domain-containing protein [Eubacterium sp.]|nr:DUF362 domain-containing protein [Eubacterium sp.]